MSFFSAFNVMRSDLFSVSDLISRIKISDEVTFSQREEVRTFSQRYRSILSEKTSQLDTPKLVIEYLVSFKSDLLGYMRKFVTTLIRSVLRLGSGGLEMKDLDNQIISMLADPNLFSVAQSAQAMLLDLKKRYKLLESGGERPEEEFDYSDGVSLVRSHGIEHESDLWDNSILSRNLEFGGAATSTWYSLASVNTTNIYPTTDYILALLVQPPDVPFQTFVDVLCHIRANGGAAWSGEWYSVTTKYERKTGDVHWMSASVRAGVAGGGGAIDYKSVTDNVGTAPVTFFEAKAKMNVYIKFRQHLIAKTNNEVTVAYIDVFGNESDLIDFSDPPLIQFYARTGLRITKANDTDVYPRRMATPTLAANTTLWYLDHEYTLALDAGDQVSLSMPSIALPDDLVYSWTFCQGTIQVLDADISPVDLTTFLTTGEIVPPRTRAALSRFGLEIRRYKKYLATHSNITEDSWASAISIDFKSSEDVMCPMTWFNVVPIDTSEPYDYSASIAQVVKLSDYRAMMRFSWTVYQLMLIDYDYLLWRAKN